MLKLKTAGKLSINILITAVTGSLAYWSIDYVSPSLTLSRSIDGPINYSLITLKESLSGNKNSWQFPLSKAEQICHKNNQDTELSVTDAQVAAVIVAAAQTQVPTGRIANNLPNQPLVKKTAPIVSRPKLAAGYVAPGIRAGYPLSYKKDAQGRLVCATKNDKPAVSKKDKPTHIDMECCLDPDEIPNPHCYYGSQYQGLINRYHNEKKQTFISRLNKQKKK